MNETVANRDAFHILNIGFVNIFSESKDTLHFLTRHIIEYRSLANGSKTSPECLMLRFTKPL